MAPSTMRKALGVVKDQTSIGLAKVSSNMAPELDVLVVKVTSHDDMPAEERHLREILHLTSCSRSYVSYCISAVSRRLGKTRDWMVALKSLMLIHRLLADGDPSFHQEVLYATRRGTRLLNLSDFRDEAHSKSWDHSAFVRTYALYLDQRLEFFLHERKNSSIPASRDQNQDRFRSPDPYQERRRHSDAYQDRYRSPDPYNHGDGSNGRYDNGGNNRFDNGSNGRYDNGGNSRFDNGSNGRYDNGNYRKSPSYGASPSTVRSPPPYTSPRDEENKKLPTPVRDMKPEQVLVRMHHLQQLLDRFLACRPTGIAKHDRMILVALYPIIRESFQLYADVCEVLGVLLDRFFDMEYNECVKSFEAYASAGKQIDELCAFYSWCKETGVARSSEYPEVQKITEKLLETLEEFMRDRAKRPKSPEPAPEPEPVKEEETPVEDMNSIKALPPPEDWKEEEPAEPVKEEVQEPPPPPPPEEPLVDLREDNVTADEQGNRLALALFSGPPANGSNGSWNAFGSSDDSNVTSAWQNPAAEPGKADWELALVETASNLSKQKANLPGGMDPLLLNGMYDQGAVKQLVNANVTTGSASSVALPLPGKATQVLALPAPDGSMQSIGGDPFAASLSIPPPAYVQMSEMEKKQQLLVQEQQVWNQYQRDGMQGQASLAKLDRGFNNGFGAAGFVPNPSIPYGMPMAYAGNPGYYYPAY